MTEASEKIKVLYVHGFASTYKPESDKSHALSKKFDVRGFDIDYTLGFSTVFEEIRSYVIAEKVDVIVGTSMGGYMAAQVGQAMGVPFVALNPAIRPSKSLEKYVGDGVDYAGNPYHMSLEAARSYDHDFLRSVSYPAYMVAVETGDEVVSATETASYVEGLADDRITVIEGGNHRFESVDLISDMVNAVFMHNLFV